eukprot:NODE_4434_length_1168_cov_60.278469_g3919_i0.p1 GENE.NODE_4434_length_1168_cov_60.278469_g3919_i0~~NODE_4434_length_1168_cov_60.278469_g3919_i0.p1  ORF type:complete len:336 (-),score=60.97 NODE_4434_length_1168_cov_60.278469_g3919_i0:159-1109(-)
MDVELPEVAILGMGVLGRNIAGELLRIGCKVNAFDVNKQTLSKTPNEINADLGMIPNFDARSALQRLVLCDELEKCVRNSTVVIESVREDIQIKRAVMNEVGRFARKMEIYFTNTMSLDIQYMAGISPFPSQLVHVRFLYPVYLTTLVVSGVADSTSLDVKKKLGSYLKLFKKSYIQEPVNHRLDPETLRKMQREICPALSNGIIIGMRDTYRLPSHGHHGHHLHHHFSAPSAPPQAPSAGPAPAPSAQNPPSAPQDAQNEDNLCKICLVNNRSVTLIPCGHLGLCGECSESIQRANGECPFCRDKVTSTIKTYAV